MPYEPAYNICHLDGFNINDLPLTVYLGRLAVVVAHSHHHRGAVVPFTDHLLPVEGDRILYMTKGGRKRYKPRLGMIIS